jgi:hypothetical protein
LRDCLILTNGQRAIIVCLVPQILANKQMARYLSHGGKHPTVFNSPAHKLFLNHSFARLRAASNHGNLPIFGFHEMTSSFRFRLKIDPI